jgi:hypothetical protein
MYKVSIENLHDAYLKGYADALNKKANMENGLEVYDWLSGTKRVNTSVEGVETADNLQSWQTEIINKEIEDFYNEDTEERLIVPRDPFGEHFTINPNSATEK